MIVLLLYDGNMDDFSHNDIVIGKMVFPDKNPAFVGNLNMVSKILGALFRDLPRLYTSKQIFWSFIHISYNGNMDDFLTMILSSKW